MTDTHSIFISYARKDGRDLALRLQNSLIPLGYEVWLDTAEIDGGGSWGAEIERAIDGCHTLLALMSPASYTSEICRAEQLRAIRKEKRIIPLLVHPTDRPIWLETLNYRDFTHPEGYESAFSQLHTDLQTTDYIAIIRPSTPNTAEPLAKHFIPRPDEFERLKNAILSDVTDRTVALTALQGMGGIGKSVLANALCHDETMQDAFPDGIFWVELGRDVSNIADKMKTIGTTLGDSAVNYSTPDMGIASLRKLLPTKSVLIVLDDVWDVSMEAAKKFLATSPRSRWLITTRDEKVGEEMGATPVELGVMTPSQAIELMKSWSERADDHFPIIAKKLGYHPLALKIVGARLKNMTTADWNTSFDSISRIKGSYSAKNRDDNLTVCFEVSVKSLPPELPPLYHALGIFPEDEWIPESIVITLWRGLNPDLSPADCADIAIDLAKLALIDRQRQDEKSAEIRTHDLLHSYNREKIKDHYANTQMGFITALGNPYALPHDYAWRFYGYHLKEAGNVARLRELIADFAWLQAKLVATDTGALVADCELVLLDEKQDPFPKLLRSALANSSHVTDADSSALAHQLAGRLMIHRKTNMDIQTFTDTILKTPKNLFPFNPDTEYVTHNPAGGMLIRTMKHDDNVNGAILLKDGRILSWSNDHTLRLWDNDGNPLSILNKHKDYVWGAMELPDGRLLSWSADESLCLWDKQGEHLKTLKKHTRGVIGAILLNNGNFLSWSDDKIMHLWSGDGEHIREITGHTGSIYGALQLPDGRLLSWGYDGTLRLWTINGSLINTLQGHQGSVNGAFVMPDGRILSWSRDAMLRLWDNHGDRITTLKGHTAIVEGACVLPNGHILSWSEDKTLRIWDKDGNPLKELTGHTQSVTGVYVFPDGRFISWGYDKSPRLWDADGEPMQILASITANMTIVTYPATFNIHLDSVNGVLPLSDNQVFSWSEDKTLRIWQLDGSPVTTLRGHSGRIRGALILNNQRILSWSRDNTLRIWDINEKPIQISSGHATVVYGVVEHPNGGFLTWSRDNHLRLWHWDGNPNKLLAGHTAGVYGQLVLANGRILSWGADSTLRLWDTVGNALKVLEGHTDGVRGAYQLSDGRFVSWSSDSTLRLWDSEGNPLKVMTDHTGSVYGALLMPDGRILSWSWDKTLRLWDNDGNLLKTMTGHTRAVNGAILLQNGNILSWSDRMFCLWDGDGNLIKTPKHDTSRIMGAIALPDGRIFTWDADRNMCLWDADMTLIATLTSDYWEGKRQTIFAWAKEHGILGADLYPDDVALGNYRIGAYGDKLIVYDPQTGARIHAFYGDASFTEPLVVERNGQTIIAAGDNVGRVLFLRWEE
ncbi:MAG: TIR domain-containing protein [bacterium]|nr:TIR domain-containing protein [bacterium]